MPDKRADRKFLVGTLLLIISMVLPIGLSNAMPPVERSVLANKLTVLVFEDHSIPAVTIELLVAAGSWQDPRGLNGIANLTAKSILLGTRQLTFDQINDRLDFLGASLDADCTKDFANLTMQVLKKDLDAGFGLFMDVLTEPTFPDSDVAGEKGNIIGKLRSLEDQPMEVANRAFEKALFLDSPYAFPVEGTEKSLAGIDREALVKFYSAFYRPNNSILVVGGDITPEEVKGRLLPRLLDWKPADIQQMKLVPTFAREHVTVAVDKPVTQATIIIGGPGVERSNRDYYALSVMNHILGSGELNSRLAAQIRVKAGLAYAVQSVVAARKYAGSLRIIIQTKNPTARDTISMAISEMERMQREPVSEAELQEARKFLIGNFPLRYGSTQQEYAKFRAQIEFFGLGMDYPEKYSSLINSITAEDVLRVAREHLKPRDHVLTVVADQEKAGMK